jgi:predicted dehydrogenase
LQFANGATGTINVSAMTHVGERGQHQQLLLFGENGTLEADLDFLQTSIRAIRHDQTQWQTLTVPDALMAGVKRALPAIDQFFAAFKEQSIGDRLFIDSILTGQSVVPSFFDGLRVQEVIDAALESDCQGCWVSVS